MIAQALLVLSSYALGGVTGRAHCVDGSFSALSSSMPGPVGTIGCMRTAISIVSGANGAPFSLKTVGFNGITPVICLRTLSMTATNLVAASFVPFDASELTFTETPSPIVGHPWSIVGGCRLSTFQPASLRAIFKEPAVSIISWSPREKNCPPHAVTIAFWPLNLFRYLLKSACAACTNRNRGPAHRSCFSRARRAAISRRVCASADAACIRALPARSFARAVSRWVSVNNISLKCCKSASASETNLSQTNSPPTPTETRAHPNAPNNFTRSSLCSFLAIGIPDRESSFSLVRPQFFNRSSKWRISWMISGPSRITPIATSPARIKSQTKYSSRMLRKSTLMLSSRRLNAESNGERRDGGAKIGEGINLDHRRIVLTEWLLIVAMICGFVLVIEIIIGLWGCWR